MSSRYWPWVLVAVSTAYLIAELVFNVRLVDNAMNTDLDVVSNLERWGRSIAATGCAVAILRLLPLEWMKRNVLLCATVLIVAWVATFFGQKALIDRYVDSSTQAQRVDAWHVTLLKQGLDSGAIKLNGLQISTGNTGRDKTLLSMLGLISYSLPKYVQLLKSRSKDIAISVADRRATESVDPLYDGFLQLRAELKSQFDAGLTAQELAKTYPPVLQRELEQFFTERRRCQHEAKPYIQVCIDAVDGAYNDKMSGTVGKKIAWKKFCSPSPASTTYQMRAGKLIPVNTDNLDCDNIEAAKIEAVLLDSMGIKYRFNSWGQFTRIPEIQKTLQKRLGKQGYVNTDIDKASFLETIVKPEFREKALTERQKWLSARITADEGRRAVRAVVVHPVALTFSLFFGVLNAAGLFAALGRIFGGTTFGHFLNAGGLVAAAIIPLIAGGHDISVSQFVSTVIPADLGAPVRWVMIVEPWIYNFFGEFLCL